MRLGSETNSVVNHLLSRGVKGQPTPAVGMGVTFLGWTDRSPGTIFKTFVVGSRLIIECRDDDYERTDKNGMSEHQTYKFCLRLQICSQSWLKGFITRLAPCDGSAARSVV